MSKIGQKQYDWLLQDQIVNGAGARTAEVFDGNANVKIWGVTTDGAENVPNGVFAPGADLVLNGAFATDTGWTKGVGWTIAAGKASSDATQTGNSDLTQTPAVALVPGEKYEVVFTVSGRTAGSVAAMVGDQAGTSRSSDATFTEQIVCGAGATLKLRADLDFDGDIDNISVTQVGDAGWTLGTGWKITGGKATSDASQAGDSDLTMTPVVPLIETDIYQVTFTVSGRTAGNVCAVVGDTEGTDRATNATFVQEIAAGAGADIDFRADLDFDGSIDNISVVRKFTGWDGATVHIQVRAEDGTTWLTAASKTADFIGTLDLGSSPNEVVRAVIASAGNQTKLSCTASR